MWDILQRHSWPQARLRQLEADEDVIPERPGGFSLQTNIAMDKRWPFIMFDGLMVIYWENVGNIWLNGDF